MKSPKETCEDWIHETRYADPKEQFPKKFAIPWTDLSRVARSHQALLAACKKAAQHQLDRGWTSIEEDLEALIKNVEGK